MYAVAQRTGIREAQTRRVLAEALFQTRGLAQLRAFFLWPMARRKMGVACVSPAYRTTVSPSTVMTIAPSQGPVGNVTDVIFRGA